MALCTPWVFIHGVFIQRLVFIHMASTPIRGIRVSDEEWEAWGRAAEAEQVSVSEWLRMAADLRVADLAAGGTSNPEVVLELVPTEGTSGRVMEVVTPTVTECAHPKEARKQLAYGTFCASELGGCGRKVR